MRNKEIIVGIISLFYYKIISAASAAGGENVKGVDFGKELKICMDHKAQGYCYWGVCKHCGVPQFIKKLQTGRIEHDEKKHEKFKKIADGEAENQ